MVYAARRFIIGAGPEYFRKSWADTVVSYLSSSDTDSMLYFIALRM